MNLALIPTLPTVPRTGTWYRALPPQYYPVSILQTAYTVNVASRFYKGAGVASPYETLYLAQSPEVALLETGTIYGSPGNTVANLQVITLFSAEVQISRLVNLTDLSIQAALQTSIQELTGAWEIYSILAALAPTSALAPAAPTHQLGAALFASGV